MYEWDNTKANSNFNKHGVSFEEAQTVFNNPLAIIFDDELHSSLTEYREIIIGHSQRNRLLLVSFTERPQAIRIISDRLTTQREREDYEKNYSNPAPDDEDDLAAEYAFDYSKAKPNRFATRDSNTRMNVIVLDEDIAQAFPTSEAVNKALRRLIEAKR